MKIALLIISAALSGCTTLREEPLEQVWQISHAIDVGMTMHTFHSVPCAEENHFMTKHLIGKHPSDGKIIAWGVGGAAIHLGVSDFLMNQDLWVLHDIWQFVSIADNGIAISSNAKVQKRGCE